MKLGIIVPYRNRKEHLDTFLPYMKSYFYCNYPNLDYTILIVEQGDNLPFNRGMLCNIGYKQLYWRADYVCFHDVDYLPLEADYSYVEAPTMLIYEGINWGKPEIILSAVVAVPCNQFEIANGFSNDYWGWGCEDMDLKNRLTSCNFYSQHRKGKFKPLPHETAARQDGLPSDFYIKNQALFWERWKDYLVQEDGHWILPDIKYEDKSWFWKSEGLNTLSFWSITYEVIDKHVAKVTVNLERNKHGNN